MQRELELDGFEVEKLLGFGPTGQVWQARDPAGQAVALKRLRPEAMAVVGRLRREAELARSLGGRHIAAPSDVVVTDRDVVFVLELATGGSLAAVLERRHRLDPAEAVTVFAPLARVLADLHKQAAVHGDLTPNNVVFAGDGRPLLTDCGVALALDAPLEAIEEIADFLEPAVLIGDVPRPAGDVYSLAAVAFTALAGQPPRIGRDRLAGFCPEAPRSLIEVIEAGIDANAERRPTATAFAAELIAACPAEPVQLHGRPTPRSKPVVLRVGPETPSASLSQPPPRRTGRLTAAAPAPEPRRLPGMAKIAVGGIFAFGLAVLAGAGWARFHSQPAPSTAGSAPHPSRTATTAPAVFAAPPDPPTPATTPTATPVKTTAAWRGVVSYLESTRVEAFATARVALLGTVYAPDAPGLAADTASVRSLHERGLHAVGFTATVERVTVQSSTAQAVSLRVVDRLSSYRLVDASGTTVDTGAARSARAFTMKLAKLPNGWRIAAIVP